MAPRHQGRPPFRADHVGSLLRPQALRQAFRRHAAGEIGDAEFAALQDQCIRDVVALQQEVGLQVVTDGEFRRGSYWGRFVERTEGFEIKPASFKFRNDAGPRSRIHRALCHAPRSSACSHWRSTNTNSCAVSPLTAKITLPAPSTMHFYRCNDFADKAVYTDVESFFADWPPCSSRRSASSPRPVAAISSSTKSPWRSYAIPASARRSRLRQRSRRAGRSLYRQHQPGGRRLPADVVVGMHMCRGNFKGHYLGAGGYESVAERFFANTTSIISCSNTIRRVPAISRRCALCPRTRASCSGLSVPRRPCWKASTP